MAPKGKHRKGKAVDQSTEWSDWAWDEHNHCWAASRIGPNGDPEYDYRDPEETQASDTSVSIPRFAGPNIITTPNYYSTTTSSNTAQYATEPDSAYTTDPVPPEQHSTSQSTYYENDASTGSNYAESKYSSYNEVSNESVRPSSSSSATGSVSTIKFAMTPMTTTGSSSTSRYPYSSSQQYENYDYEDVATQALQRLSVSTSSVPQATSM